MKRFFSINAILVGRQPNGVLDTGRLAVRAHAGLREGGLGANSAVLGSPLVTRDDRLERVFPAIGAMDGFPAEVRIVPDRHAG
jgi:hypothetical protein